jgi:hypothetical protein
MADVSEVSQSLVTLVERSVYPNGNSQPSIANVQILIYAGWPNQRQLEDDLKAGKVHVSVFPRPDDKVTFTPMGGAETEVSNDGTQGLVRSLVRRQRRTFQITVWANRYTVRDLVAAKLDPLLGLTRRIELADGTLGILCYASSTQDDNAQKFGVYRRDLFYSVEYETTLSTESYSIKEIDMSLSNEPDSGLVMQIAVTDSTVTLTTTP